MHAYTDETERLARAVLDYASRRLRLDPVPLDGPRPLEDLDRLAGQTITSGGLGGEAALRLFEEVLAPACISTDNPRSLAFIPAAPSEAATLFDLVVGATSIFGGSWREGAGAVFAENQALRWLADLAGLPAGAGGVFVPGGTLGNLSALVAARHSARERRAGSPPARWKLAATTETHSSIRSAARVMDADVVDVPVGEGGRLTGAGLRRALEREGTNGLFAVVATAGTTNTGVIDRLAELAAVCAELGVWFHVDGAYGLAALAAPSARGLFAGVERADSLIVDPHKWLFAPFDCCALLYREPELARAAHAQRAGYLQPLATAGEWNPSDFAIHLTRRARGLPFWFSLAVHGTRAYAESIERTLAVARAAAADVESRPYLDLLLEPELSILVIRRRGWEPHDYDAWSRRLLRRGTAFVVPTVHRGETVARLAIVNPRTTPDDIAAVLDTMA
ncbi:MAG: aminotransferase class V-fold PLP-dependent enzyme [Thermoleophilia bacterium]|nr:aminotransferase class V-fold PLP-dependent enzyme [Thermoleophilia bacterium]